MKKRLLLSIILLAGLVFAMTKSNTSDAHEGRVVEGYEIVLGWRVEPAFVGEYNGPEFFIYEHIEHEEGEHEEGEEQSTRGEPIVGAEETLQLEVSFGSATKILNIRPAFRDPGHYIGELIPTRPGDYTFHLTGTIGDIEIDEVFTSADGKFGSVEPVNDILFPDESLVTIQDLQAQIDDLRALLEALQAE